MKLDEALRRAAPLDGVAMKKAREKWLSVAKPLFSLGRLEEAIEQIAGILGSEIIPGFKKGIIVMCADNGIVAEGVTQCGQEITAAVAENMSRGNASVCIMAQIAGAEVFPVDIGVLSDIEGVTEPETKIRRGTGNIAREAAMTRAEAAAAVEVGINMVKELKDGGYNLIATGEMGIGNTSTSSAAAAVLLGAEPERVVGRGAGLSSEGLERKITAVKRAIDINKPDASDPMDVLSKVGGLDIAGMAGVFIGGACFGVPVIIDGIISGTAALIASRLCPEAKDYMIASHVSKEPAGHMILEALEKKPFIDCGMFLGEGTGAAALFPMLDMSLAVYNKMSTFDKWGHGRYEILT